MAELPERLGVELLRRWKGSWRRSEIAFSGGSMGPLTEGAVALVVSHGSRAPRVGDIVLTLQRGALITHRIIQRIDSGAGAVTWITQGDASPVPDPSPVAGDDVLGVVVGLALPQGVQEIGGPCWAWTRRLAAAQARWISGGATTSPSGSPAPRRLAGGLHRRALRGAFGTAGALEALRTLLEDWQVQAFRSPLARLIARRQGELPPTEDLIAAGLRQAEDLGMALMFLRWLRLRGLPCRGIDEALAQRKASAAFRSLRWRPRIEAVVQALRHLGIEPMALKGFAQSLTLYRGELLRAMQDIDLLVPPGREAEARAALAALGFVEGHQVDEPDFLHHHHGVPQIDPETRLVVELHREVVPERLGARSLTEGFWSRGETVTFAGAELRVPCREDRLLHLCLHLRLHRYLGCLRDALEIALLVEDDSPPWDWGKVERLARDSDIVSTLHLGLRLSVLAFRAPVPPEFLAHLRAAIPRRSFAETRIRLLARQLTGPPPERRDAWVKAARRLCKAAAPL